MRRCRVLTKWAPKEDERPRFDGLIQKRPGRGAIHDLGGDNTQEVKLTEHEDVDGNQNTSSSHSTSRRDK